MRALIVDDEPLARRRLRRLLVEHDDIEVVGECKDAQSAVTGIRELLPDVVFLDIEMPGATGFDVIADVDQQPTPVVVFVTAYPEHAVNAFDEDVADYLLKPFDRDRLARSLERARRVAKSRDEEGLIDDLKRVIARLEGDGEYVRRLAVTLGRKTLLIPVDEIDWIEAKGNYVVLRRGSKQFLLRSTMSGLEGRLDPRDFVRIHRSTIVRIDRVRELRTLHTGKHIAILEGDTELPISPSYWAKLAR